MAFSRLFATTLSETASSNDFTVNFGDVSLSSSLSGIVSTSSLSAEAPAIVKYVRYKLGEPVLSVQSSNAQIFLAFEEANLHYSAIVNTYQAKSWMIQYYGLSNDFSNFDFTGKLPAPFANFVKRLTQNIAWEISPPIGGNVGNSLRKSYITLVPGKQDYDIYNDIIDNTLSVALSAAITSLTSSVNSSNIDLKTVYHYPAMTLYRFYDPYSSINLLSQEFNFESFNTESIFYVLPIWTDILRAQMLNLNDKVRRSNFSYERVGNRFRIFPVPKHSLKLWIDYGLSQQNPFSSTDRESASGISNFYQIPFTDIAYNKINPPGRMWIREYTFALSMEIEGRIRRKFDKIPIPNDSITMDGSTMVQEAIQKMQELEKNLRTDLDELSVNKIMENETKRQEMIQAQYKNYPIYPLMM